MSSVTRNRAGRPSEKKVHPSTLGGFIRKTRIDKGWSLAKLAEKAGIARAYVQKLEGNESEPSFAVIVRVARVLGLKLDHMAWRVAKKERE